MDKITVANNIYSTHITHTKYAGSGAAGRACLLTFSIVPSWPVPRCSSPSSFSCCSLTRERAQLLYSKNSSAVIAEQMPVVRTVTFAVTEKLPFCEPYTFTSVEIKPAIELRSPGLPRDVSQCTQNNE